MYATGQTWLFKTTVISVLESSGVGYDTRFHYYRQQYPDTDVSHLARMVCDPIEYYDKDWPEYLANKDPHKDEEEAVVDFVLLRDCQFQREAQGAIYCYDEAGFGSGINTMRFINAGKPIIGFYNCSIGNQGINLSNILQLKVVYPNLVTLVEYSSPGEISDQVIRWINKVSKHI